VEQHFTVLSIDEFESITLIVEHDLLVALLIQLYSSTPCVEAVRLHVKTDALGVRLVLLNSHHFFSGSFSVHGLDILCKFAFLELGQCQNVFDVEGQHLAGGFTDLEAFDEL